MALARAGARVIAYEVTPMQPARAARPNGWWGMALFVATEAALFACLIASWFYLRFQNHAWPPPGIPEPKVALSLVLTAMLVATSIPMAFAYASGRRGRRGLAWLSILAAFAVQCVYLGVQVHLFRDDLAKFPADSHAYASSYFTLLAVDHVHVLVGILFNAWLLARLATGLTRYRLVGLGAIAFYWHAVNVITICVTLTILSAAL
jgi:heme/copper-type cytochrome/quinol oxidase subunit 3